MNKKGMGLQAIIVIILIMVVVLVYIFSLFSSEGLMNTIAGEANKLLGRYYPKYNKEQLSESDLSTKRDASGSFLSMQQAFTDAKESADTGCWAPFTEVPSDLTQWRLEFKQQGANINMKLIETVAHGDTGEDEVTEHNYIINDANLCALEGSAATAFYTSLKNGPGSVGGEYNPTSNIKIVEEGITGRDPEMYVDGRIYDYEGSTILYKPSANYICLIPVHDFGFKWGCDIEDGSLDDDCIDDIKNKVKQCRVI